MIKKIISSLSPADRVVIEFAVQMGIPLLDTYRPELVKASLHSYRYDQMRINQLRPLCGHKLSYDIIYWDFFWRDRWFFNTDGTLILSDGNNTKTSEYLCYLADENLKPLLHLDITKTSATEAASEINRWIASHEVELLNVSGPDRDQDLERNTQMHNKIRNILKLLPFVSLAEKDISVETRISSNPYILNDDKILYKGYLIDVHPMHASFRGWCVSGRIYRLDAYPFKCKWFTNRSEYFKHCYEVNIPTFAFGMQIVDGTANDFEVYDFEVD